MDGNRVTVSGLSAQLRWSYAVAATLGPWTVTADRSGHTLTAHVVSHDAYKVSQQPLSLVVPRPNGRPSWVWPIQSLQIADGTLSASLGPQGS